MEDKQMFKGRLDFCSNFYTNYDRFQFEWFGYKWYNAECAYQFAKCRPSGLQKLGPIFSTLSASNSKKLGREVYVRDDWDEVKLDIMKSILMSKFNNYTLSKMLKDTGEEELVEWNYWNDTFWGKSLKSGEGENNLGRILMEIRSAI